MKKKKVKRAKLEDLKIGSYVYVIELMAYGYVTGIIKPYIRVRMVQHDKAIPKYWDGKAGERIAVMQF